MDRKAKIEAAKKVIAASSALSTSDGFRDVAEEALLAAGAIEAVTRGEVVAEELLYVATIGDRQVFCFRICPYGGTGLFETPYKGACAVSQADRLSEARALLAGHIDAEIATARDAALDEAAAACLRAGHCLAGDTIRALKGARP